MLCHLVSRCQQFQTSLTMTQYNIPDDLDLLLDLHQIFLLRHVSGKLRVLWLTHQVYMHKSGMYRTIYMAVSLILSFITAHSCTESSRLVKTRTCHWEKETYIYIYIYISVPTVSKICIAFKHARTMCTLTLQACLWCLSLAQGTSWHLLFSLTIFPYW
jgi:hypothetical protein